MLRRRQFLVAGLAGLAGLTGLVTWRFIRSSDEDAIIAVLRKRLDYLLLDDNGLRAFAGDLVAQKTISGNKLRMLDVAGPVYTQLSFASYRNALARALRHGEERIVTLYLLSSDFFPTGADETRTVRYVGYYDPIRYPRPPCSNPFSRPITI
ncbi:MAG: hypothetical protein WBO23_10540 [Burkholderiales bacterium]